MDRFLLGNSENVIERLCATMNAIDSEWGKKIKPASKEQIEHFKDLIGFNEKGIEIPKVYLDFLETMGQEDGGLLENEWDGYTDVNINAITGCYCGDYEEITEYDPKDFLLFSSHWSEAYLYLDMSKGDNPPVYNSDILFADSFEKYLFHMAFRYMYKDEYKDDDNWLPPHVIKKIHELLNKKTSYNETKEEKKDYISKIMNSLSFEKMWFSDSVRDYYHKDGVVVFVNVYYNLGILVVGNDADKVLQVKNDIINLVE